MSKVERTASIVIGIVGLVLMAIPAWDTLERRGLVSGAILILVWLICAALVAYSVYRNLKDAQRAESLHAQIVTIKDEHKMELAGLQKRLEEQYRIDLRKKEAWWSQEQIKHNTEANSRLREALRDLPTAGICGMMANEAERLSHALQEMIDRDRGQRPEYQKCWMYPLEDSIFPDDAPWVWQHRAWHRWQARYMAHQDNILKVWPGFESGVTQYSVPTNRVNNGQVLTLLHEHSETLFARFHKLVTPYEESE